MHSVMEPMTGMPNNLYFVRHAHSEGNLIQEKLRAGLEVPKTAVENPDFAYRLTNKGREQATKTGVWFQTSKIHLDAGFCSSAVRPRETAWLMNLGLLWKESPFLMERSWGDFMFRSKEEQHRYKKERRKDPLFSHMASGQSMAEALVPSYLFCSTLAREYNGQDVIALVHGEKMFGFRVLLERLGVEAAMELWASKAPEDQMDNCRMLHYTRIDPRTGEQAKYLNWVRSIVPWKPEMGGVDWRPIVRKKFTDEDLRVAVEKYPRFFPDE